MSCRWRFYNLILLMKSKIVLAKDELYDNLMQYQEVVGAAVRHSGRRRYIVIMLSKITTNILSRIPSKFKGTVVKHEITGKITSR